MPLYGKIVIIKRSGKDGTAYPLIVQTCIFGREKNCDIIIDLPNVAKEHCALEVQENGKVLLKSLSSSSVTLLNGTVLKQNKAVDHKDTITVIDRCFRFEYPPGSEHRKLLSPLHVSSWQMNRTPKVEIPPAPQSAGRTPRPPRKNSSSPKKSSPRKLDAKSNSPRHFYPSRKSVSFGPVLSPEQFHNDLPPSTPIKRGRQPLYRESSPFVTSSKMRLSVPQINDAIVEESPKSLAKRKISPGSDALVSPLSKSPKTSPLTSPLLTSSAKKVVRQSTSPKKIVSPATFYNSAKKPKNLQKRRSFPRVLGSKIQPKTQSRLSVQLPEPKENNSFSSTNSWSPLYLSPSLSSINTPIRQRRSPHTIPSQIPLTRHSLASQSPPKKTPNISTPTPVSPQRPSSTKVSPASSPSPSKRMPETGVLVPTAFQQSVVSGLQKKSPLRKSVSPSSRAPSRGSSAKKTPARKTGSLSLRAPSRGSAKKTTSRKTGSLSSRAPSRGSSAKKTTARKTGSLSSRAPSRGSSAKKTPARKAAVSPSSRTPLRSRSATRSSKKTPIPKIIAPTSPDSKKSKALITIHASQLRSQLKKGKTPKSLGKPLFSEMLKLGLMQRPPTSGRKKKAARKLVALAIKKKVPIKRKNLKTPATTRKKRYIGTGHANSPETIVIRKAKLSIRKKIITSVNSALTPKERASTSRQLSTSLQESIEVSYFKTPNVTQDTFISPINTPGTRSTRKSGMMEQFLKDSMKSPPSSAKSSTRLSSVKRLSSMRNTPDDDNLSGILQLDPSPAGRGKKITEARLSMKADYSNVQGMKKLFGKQAPQANYSNVKGLKRLLRTPNASPKSSYDNVHGLKRLFRSPVVSPKANYSDVKGMVRLMRSPRSSPKPDYTDVRGVKALLRTPKEVPEVEYDGLEELFITPKGRTPTSSVKRKSPTSSPPSAKKSPKIVGRGSPVRSATRSGRGQASPLPIIVEVLPEMEPRKSMSPTKSLKGMEFESPVKLGSASRLRSSKDSPLVNRVASPAKMGSAIRSRRVEDSPKLKEELSPRKGRPSISPTKSPLATARASPVKVASATTPGRGKALSPKPTGHGSSAKVETPVSIKGSPLTVDFSPKMVLPSPVKVGSATRSRRGKASPLAIHFASPVSATRSRRGKASPLKANLSPRKDRIISPEVAHASPLKVRSSTRSKKGKASPVTTVQSSPAEIASGTRSRRRKASPMKENISPKMSRVSPENSPKAHGSSPAKVRNTTRSRRGKASPLPLKADVSPQKEVISVSAVKAASPVKAGGVKRPKRGKAKTLKNDPSTGHKLVLSPPKSPADLGEGPKEMKESPLVKKRNQRGKTTKSAQRSPKKATSSVNIAESSSPGIRVPTPVKRGRRPARKTARTPSPVKPASPIKSPEKSKVSPSLPKRGRSTRAKSKPVQKVESKVVSPTNSPALQKRATRKQKVPSTPSPAKKVKLSPEVKVQTTPKGSRGRTQRNKAKLVVPDSPDSSPHNELKVGSKGKRKTAPQKKASKASKQKQPSLSPVPELSESSDEPSTPKRIVRKRKAASPAEKRQTRSRKK